VLAVHQHQEKAAMKAKGQRDEEHSRWKMHAQAEGEGRVYQAGGDQHLTVHVHGVESESESEPYRMAALMPLIRLAQFVLVLAFIVCAMATGLALYGGGFTVEFLKGLGLTSGILALLMVAERITTGRWHRWSRTRQRAARR
jgi:ABC-type nickel/cobalt efflux system permease component RcnA